MAVWWPLTNIVKQFSISAEAVKKLFSQIPFPGLDVKASTFEVDEIWEYLERTEREIQKGLSKELISVCYNCWLVNQLNF